jgi:hypothetical protein
MAPHRDRLQILEARCSGFALELLNELKQHPTFPKLVMKLEQIAGMIIRSDVEKAFAEINADQGDSR